MKKVLLVDDELEILEILETLILSEIDCEITKCNSGNKAIQELQEANQYDIILSDYNMPDGNGADLFEYNVTNMNLPFIFISGGYLEDYKDVKNFYDHNELNFFINKPVDFELLINQLEKVFSNDKSSGAFIRDEKTDSKKYSQIRFSFLKNYDISNYEIYMKLSDNNFVKVKNIGDESFEDLERYEKKVEDKYYLKQEDLNLFLQDALKEHIYKVSRAPANISEIEILGSSLEIMHDSLKALGMTELQMSLAVKTVESCIKTINSDKTLKNIFKSFLKSKGYFVSHSITSCFLSYLLAKELEIDNETTMAKLCMASLMHDLTLADSEFCKIYDLSTKEFIDLKNDQKKLIETHAFECSEMCSKLDVIAGDVVTMIKDHHEWPNGGGFPRGVDSNSLFALSQLFITVLHLSDHLFKNGHGADSILSFKARMRIIGIDEERTPKIYRALNNIFDKASS